MLVRSERNILSALISIIHDFAATKRLAREFACKVLREGDLKSSFSVLAEATSTRSPLQRVLRLGPSGRAMPSLSTNWANWHVLSFCSSASDLHSTTRISCAQPEIVVHMNKFCSFHLHKALRVISEQNVNSALLWLGEWLTLLYMAVQERWIIIGRGEESSIADLHVLRRKIHSTFEAIRTKNHLTATSAIATLVGAQTSTLCPQPASTDSSRAMVDVLPVPGGPCAYTRSCEQRHRDHASILLSHSSVCNPECNVDMRIVFILRGRHIKPLGCLLQL